MINAQQLQHAAAVQHATCNSAQPGHLTTLPSNYSFLRGIAYHLNLTPPQSKALLQL